jgi:hypothetical protein
MDNSITPLDYYPQYPSYVQQLRDEPTDLTPRFSLPIDDNDLYMLIQQKRKAAEDGANTLKINSRRARNKDYWRGKHYDETTGIPPDDYRSDYMDPLVYENSETRFTLASQRMPDIIVEGKNDDNKSVENATLVEKFLRKKVNNKMTQRMIKGGLRQHQLSYIAAIKPLWNPVLANGTGDIQFTLVNPSRLILDPTATIPYDGYTADNMTFVGEILEDEVEAVYKKFPGKKDELRALLETMQVSGLPVPTKLKYEEWWLSYWKGGEKYESTVWLYQTLVLGKMKNAYYDWDGYKVYMPKLDKNDNYKQTTTLQSELRYYNYFEIPRKPYIFFSYQNLGDGPYDDTTAVEQSLPTQKLIDRVGRQIVEISQHAVPKMIFGNGITKEDARRVSDDPSERIWLDMADVTKAMTWIQANPPAPELLALQQDARQRMNGLYNTHGPIKGEQSPTNESGTAKQITREGDLTVSDDLVDIVVERVVFEMAGWAMQLAKLLYDEPHFLRATGSAGQIISRELTRQDFTDDLLVNVKANSVDEQTNRADALNYASRKATDPLTMFEDMDKTNPMERTRRWLAFTMGAQDGYATYMKEIGLQLEATSNPQPPFTVGGDETENQDQAKEDVKSMTTGQIIAPPNKFDQTYVQVFLDFIHSGQYKALPGDIQANFKDFVTQLIRNFQNFNVNTPGSAFTPGQAQPIPPGIPQPGQGNGIPPQPVAQPQPAGVA